MAQFNDFGQGTVEYLVIVSIVVVLALVVVGLLVNQTDSISGVSVSSNELGSKVGVGGLSLSSSVVGVDGNGLLIIKNLNSENIILSRIVVDGVDHNFSEQLISGDEKGFKLKGVAACEFGVKSKSYSVKVEYVSSSGLTKINDFQTISMACTGTVTATKNPVEETSSLVFFDGNALSFDGSNDYINSGNIPLTGSFSVSVWVNIQNSLSNEWQLFIDKGSTQSLLGVNPSRGLCFRLTSSGDLCSPSTLNTGIWYNIVAVCDSSTQQQMLYINGDLNSTKSSTCVNNPNSTSYWRFGARSGSAFYYLHGTMDELTFFNRALTSLEISQLYNSGDGLYANTSIAPFSSSLIAAYHFDEGSGTTAVDSAGSYNGTLINGPLYTTGEVGYYE